MTRKDTGLRAALRRLNWKLHGKLFPLEPSFGQLSRTAVKRVMSIIDEMADEDIRSYRRGIIVYGHDEENMMQNFVATFDTGSNVHIVSQSLLDRMPGIAQSMRRREIMTPDQQRQLDGYTIDNHPVRGVGTVMLDWSFEELREVTFPQKFVVLERPRPGQTHPDILFGDHWRQHLKWDLKRMRKNHTLGPQSESSLQNIRLIKANQTVRHIDHAESC